MLRVSLLALGLALSPHTAGAIDFSGTITILEGTALVYRGTGCVHAASGLRLTRGDIIETAPATFAQIELIDRSVLQMGSATRVLITAPALRQKPERGLYVLDGWVKMDGSKREAAAGPGFEIRTPLVDLPAEAAVVVMRQSASDVALFAERGAVHPGERQASGANVPVPLKGGDFYARKPGARSAVTVGASKAFVNDMPREFRDLLPPMLEKFGDRVVQAVDAPDFAYADVERWLKAEPSVRRSLMPRWRRKAREPAFRSALIANLSAHPEWDPILFPEKYLPKKPPSANASLAAGRPVSSSAAASAAN